MVAATLADGWRERLLTGGLVGTEEMMLAATSMVSARRALRVALPADFLHAPSLDMLLALYLAPRHELDPDDLYASTTVPNGVSRRWVDALEQQGLVARARHAVTLTTAGRQSLEAALTAVINSQRVVHA